LAEENLSLKTDFVNAMWIRWYSPYLMQNNEDIPEYLYLFGNIDADTGHRSGKCITIYPYKSIVIANYVGENDQFVPNTRHCQITAEPTSNHLLETDDIVCVFD
jgi:hypothetical protein